MTSPLGRPGSCSYASGTYGVHRHVEAVLEVIDDCSQDVVDWLKSIPGRQEYVSCAVSVRRAGESVAWYALPLPNHLAWFSENGFTREDSRKIRYLVERAYDEEPSQVLMVALALLRATNGTELSGLSRAASPDHPFHRSLAAWPRYQEKLASDVSVSMLTGEYERAVGFVQERAWRLAEGLCPSEAPAMGVSADAVSALTERLWASCGVVVLVSALRRMFIRAETAARHGR